MKLTDDELEEVAGGVGAGRISIYKSDRTSRELSDPNVNGSPAKKRFIGRNHG